ncbi:class I SAM-dependent methyltransferase [Kribbella sp. CA-253562]|uniref:class I SAM-dependent methyltransferase n=1 Tax=Kribbella sp. CA-253562 TaxID=3239942 RepID=UPI003D8D4222
MNEQLARGWDDAAAGYEKFWVPRFRPWVEAAVAAVDDLPTGPILVPCCGTFPELDLLLERFPGREIVGVDLSPGMVELAHERIGGREQARAIVGDAAVLDAKWRGECAAVVSVFGLQQLPEPVQAISSWYDVLRPGGRLSVVFWPSVVEQDGPFALMRELLNPAAPDPDPDFAEVLGDALDRDERVVFPIRYPDAATFFDGYSRSGPMRATAIARGDAFVDEIRRRFLERAPEGEWTHQPAARLITATGR